MTPGYKTSEFWLKLAAVVLTALYASGIIPTSGNVATLVAIIATVLTSLGYTVARTFLKSGGAAILVIALVSQVGCAATKREISVVKDGIVQCAKADLPTIRNFALQLGTSLLVSTFTEHPDWPTIWRGVADNAQRGVKLHGLAIATCAFDVLITRLEEVPPTTQLRAMSTSEATSTARTDPIGIGLMELENFRMLNGIHQIREIQ